MLAKTKRTKLGKKTVSSKKTLLIAHDKFFTLNLCFRFCIFAKKISGKE